MWALVRGDITILFKFIWKFAHQEQSIKMNLMLLKFDFNALLLGIGICFKDT